MRGSSINFKKALRGAFNHNDRTEAQEAGYLLSEEYRLKNEFDISAADANKKIKKLHARASRNYQNKYGQEIQAKTYILEAVVNLDSHHTLEDVMKMVKELNKITGFTHIQVSIHRDEGVLGKDKNGKEVVLYNYHAHIVFFTLNLDSGLQLYRKDISKPLRREYKEQVVRDQAKNMKLKPPFHLNEVVKPKKKTKWHTEDRIEINKEIRRRFKRDGYIVYDRERMSYLQTVVAEKLGMPRGTVSVEAEAKRLGVTLELNPAVRKEHKQHRATQRDEEKLREYYLKEQVAMESAHKHAMSVLEKQIQELQQSVNAQLITIDEKDKTITELDEKVYSDRYVYLYGKKTNRKLTYQRLVELRDEKIKTQKVKIASLEEEVKSLEKELKPTGYDIEGYQVPKEIYELYGNLNKEYSSSQYRVKVLEEKEQKSKDRIEGRNQLFDQTIEQYNEKIEHLEKSIYTGQKYPMEFDENNNEIKFEKETWKARAHNEEKKTLNFLAEIEHLTERINELEELAYYDEMHYDNDKGMSDFYKVSYKEEKIRLEEKLSTAQQIISMLKEFDIPSDVLEGSLDEVAKNIIVKNWPKKKEKIKLEQSNDVGITSGLNLGG